MVAMDFNAPTPEERAEIKRRKAAISRRIRKEVLAELGIDKLPEVGERVLITGAQGTGKSRAVAEGIAAERHEIVVWWLVPTLKKAEEQATEYDRIADPESMAAMVVRGRAAADPRVPGEAMCPRHEVVNRAAAMGVEVQKEICRSCPLAGECGFQAQRKRLNEHPTGLFLMSSEYLYLPCPAPHADLVVVDESIIDRAAEVASFEPGRITDDDKWSVRGDFGASMELRITASAVRRAITEHPGRELEFLRNEGITRDDLGRCILHLRRSEEATPNVNGLMSDRQIAAALDAVEQREILKVLKLFRQIRRELDQPRRRLNSVWFDPDARVKVEGETERQPRVFASFVRDPALATATPVLALDGTGSIELNRKIFGDRMGWDSFRAPRDALVIQATDKTFSRQSLTGCDRHGKAVSAKSLAESARLRGYVLELLRLLPGKVLLVTNKPVEEKIVGELPKHVSVAHFGDVRGLNEFERHETVVILGREQPSAPKIEEKTRPFTASDPEPFLPFGEYVKQSRGRRQRQEGTNVVEVPVHPDPRCQALLEQVREAETVQAVDRVRPVFNRRTIILLADVPVDVTVDHVVPWQELRPGKLLVALARHGVLPLAPSDMAKAFPDIWKSVKAAQHAVERGRGIYRLDIPKPPIDSLLGVWGSLFPTLVTASYRRNGQRGHPGRVVLYADLPDPRATLEALLGPLADFQIDVTEPPTATAQPPEPPPPPPPSPRGDRPLPPLAAALAAQAHLLASSDPSERPPEMLGFAGVRRLMNYAAA